MKWKLSQVPERIIEVNYPFTHSIRDIATNGALAGAFHSDASMSVFIPRRM
jgi:hypothetical protein